jgi:hypothetical protein
MRVEYMSHGIVVSVVGHHRHHYLFYFVFVLDDTKTTHSAVRPYLHKELIHNLLLSHMSERDLYAYLNTEVLKRGLATSSSLNAVLAPKERDTSVSAI